MVKLKEYATFSGKKYKRHDSRYGTKEDAIKKAKDLRKKGFRVIRDKSGEGHFLWVHKTSWTAKKPKPKAKPKPKPRPKYGIIDKDMSVSLAKEKGIAKFLYSGRGTQKVFDTKDEADWYRHKQGLKHGKIVTLGESDLEDVKAYKEV